MNELIYVGNELELFQHASNWKKYFGAYLMPYLNGTVLEVGAGIGGTTMHLCNGSQKKWVCLEPDPSLFSELEEKIQDHELPNCCIPIKGTIASLPPHEKYNTILYIDVIEHIENDISELMEAEKLLCDNGYLIVLVPAHQFVYNSFDKSIGHFRRYNKRMLLRTAPPNLKLKKIIYLDSMGLVASILNRFFLKQKYPTAKQIKMWDKSLVRISKVTDFILNYKIGKTLIAIWQKNKI
jgi:ubiquinone/menaquinone biosynthesis C-methylase UbiE